MLFLSIKENLNQLSELLTQLSPAQYQEALPVLSGASIGGHYRHVIELFLSLLKSYDDGKVNYESRPRDNRIATNRDFAQEQLNFIKQHMEQANKDLFLIQEIQGEQIIIASNFFRELLYNWEHTIHHEALIKIGVEQFETIDIVTHFGIAPSTLAFRQRCAQ
ncbi:MAG TPA: DinB family protein [Leeuwenhoekiella sp.]|nr:DinB family protein [Leeuwenhoekiella sp.]